MEDRVQAAASRASCCLLQFVEVLVQVRLAHDFEENQLSSLIDKKTDRILISYDSIVNRAGNLQMIQGVR